MNREFVISPGFMKPLQLIKYIFLILLFLQSIWAERLMIISPVPKTGQNEIRVLTIEGSKYLSLQDLAAACGVRTYYRKESGKLVLFFSEVKIKIPAYSTFIMFDSQILHMPQPAVRIDEDMYIPVYPFMDYLKDRAVSDLQYVFTERGTEMLLRDNRIKDAALLREIALKQRTRGNLLLKVDYEEKANGITARIKTKGTFKDADLSYFFKDDDWFYLTVYGASCDSTALSALAPSPSIQRVEAIPKENSVQLMLQLNRKFTSADAHFDLRTGRILVSLFLPLNRNIKQKIERAKTAWVVDTVVLDPGHGGKDPGTPGRWGQMHEKDIVLDVALRVGELLEKKSDLKVVYTRKTDKFVPLWKRAEIANKNSGKIFISLHVDGNENHNVDGVCFYLLRPGKSEDAIKVAEAENSVIQLEEESDKAKYEGYDDITNILANMVHSVNMRDSERMAEIFSKHFGQDVDQKNRGVKQAGFYVLVGADMPKLLCELGFNSNRGEARKLNRSRHRQQIAEAICNSIIEFKEVCDQSVSKNY